MERNIGTVVNDITKLNDSRKWALIIGINNYTDQNITPLQYAVNDAQKLHELLIDQEYGGFEESKTKLLTDETPIKPTRDEILRALNGLQVASDRDSVFIFFAGHGIEERGENYFLPIDTDISLLSDYGIPIKRFLQPLKAKIKVLFFDACHSGVIKTSRSSGTMGHGMYHYIHEYAQGQAILSSCGQDEIAYEYPEKKHGVFTYFLLDALRGKADLNSNDRVSLTEAVKYTTEKVLEWSFHTGKRQTPQWNIHGIGEEIILTQSRAGGRLTELEKKRKEIEAELAKIRQERGHAKQEREVELTKKLEQAKGAEEAERIRKEEQAEVERHRIEQETTKRERMHREKAESEELNRQLEKERKRLAAEQSLSMTMFDAIKKAQEIKKQIDNVRPPLELKIEREIAAVPKPKPIKIIPKGEFEKQATYQARVQRARQQEAEDRRRYEQEIARIRGRLKPEVEAQMKVYEEALAQLSSRKLVLDETQVFFDLGTYDAEGETFPNATISTREDFPIPEFSWNFAVPIDLAPQFKRSVESGTVEISAYVDLDVLKAKAEIQAVRVEDLSQKKTFDNFETFVERLRDERLRDRARDMLIHIGRPVVPVLIKALVDKDPSVRSRAAEALGKIGSPPVSAIPTLIKALNDKNDIVCQNAAKLLGEIGEPAKAATPALVKALVDKVEKIRQNAAVALCKIAKPVEDIVPTLMKLLRLDEILPELPSDMQQQINDICGKIEIYSVTYEPENLLSETQLLRKKIDDFQDALDVKAKAIERYRSYQQKLEPALEKFPTDTRQQAEEICEQIKSLLATDTYSDYVEALNAIQQAEQKLPNFKKALSTKIQAIESFQIYRQRFEPILAIDLPLDTRQKAEEIFQELTTSFTEAETFSDYSKVLSEIEQLKEYLSEFREALTIKTQAIKSYQSCQEQLKPLLEGLPTDTRQQAEEICEQIESLIATDSHSDYVLALNAFQQWKKQLPELQKAVDVKTEAVSNFKQAKKLLKDYVYITTEARDVEAKIRELFKQAESFYGRDTYSDYQRSLSLLKQIQDVFESIQSYSVELATLTDMGSPLAFSPDVKILATGSRRNSVKLWSVAKKNDIATLTGHSDDVKTAAFSPDGEILATGSNDNSVKLWSVAKKTEIGTLTGHSDDVKSAAFSPDGKILATGSTDNSVKLWSVAEGTEITTIKRHNDTVKALAFSPDGEIIAIESNKKVDLWSISKETSILTLKVGKNEFKSIIFSPDGKMFATGSNKSVDLWSPDKGTKIGTLTGHSDDVRALAFSPDGKILATGSNDGTVKLWSIAKETEISTLKGHDSWVEVVAFSSDGEILAMGSNDGAVKLWSRSAISHQENERRQRQVVAEISEALDRAVESGAKRYALTESRSVKDLVAQAQSALDEGDFENVQRLTEQCRSEIVKIRALTEARIIEEKRRRSSRCVVCGKKLSFFDKRSGHDKCKIHRLYG